MILSRSAPRRHRTRLVFNGRATLAGEPATVPNAEPMRPDNGAFAFEWSHMGQTDSAFHARPGGAA